MYHILQVTCNIRRSEAPASHANRTVKITVFILRIEIILYVI